MTDDEAELPRAIIVGREGGADHRLDAEYSEQIVGRDRRGQFLGRTEAAGVVHPLVGVQRGVSDDRQRRQIVQFGNGHRSLLIAAHRADADEAIRIGEGRRTQQEPVHRAEDDRVRADAKAQCANDEGREGGLTPGQPEGLAKIGEDRLHGGVVARPSSSARGIPTDGRSRPEIGRKRPSVG